MDKRKKPLLITCFYCVNCLDDEDLLSLKPESDIDLKLIRLACSSQVKDVFLLRAFESGADEVLVCVCPQGACRYVQGNARAEKRIGRVQQILEGIGIGRCRLNVCQCSPNVEETKETLRKAFSDALQRGKMEFMS